jgi:hypothetical protein
MKGRAGVLDRTSIFAVNQDNPDKQMNRERRAVAAFDFDNTITESTIEDGTGDNEVVYNMGCVCRVNALRTLFRDLRACGVMLIVVSLNMRKNIERILDQHGLLEFFTAIYDRNDIWRIDVRTKQNFMQLFMDKYDVKASHCVLLDDQSNNLENAPCTVIEIKGPGGICRQHDSELRRIFMQSTNSQ